MSYKGTKLSSESKKHISDSLKGKRIEFVCKICSKKFEVIPARARQNPKYCSFTCYGLSLRNKKPWNKGITADMDSRIATSKRHGMYGKRNPRWNGGKFTEQGYVLVWCPSHPDNRRGYVRQHRLIMESHIGRLLKHNEVVHHINGITTDNRIENLKLMDKLDHVRLHSKNRSKL